MGMTTNLPLAAGLADTTERSSRFSEEELSGLRSEFENNVRKLENRRRRHESAVAPGFWTGTREGVVATVIAVVGSMLFGGAAGIWFTAEGAGWFGEAMRMAGGTLGMASLVTLAGSLITGRNPIFWGVGMPLLVYAAGSLCAFMSAGAGASMFLFGAPVFCGLAILAGLMTAFAIDRGR